MRITSIPQIYRNIRRWTEIISVLSKYGLADWISRSNVDFAKDHFKDRQGEALARQTQEKRIRLALTELGPAFIKLGQLLSTRPDVVGIPLATELQSLQTAVPADPAGQVRQLIEDELGQPVSELFEDFEDEPIASASIGQVHRARLKSGENVVVKVQHHKIESLVKQDLEVLSGLAQLADGIPEFAPYRPSATAAELGRALRRELDFGREERNLQQFGLLWGNNSEVRIPRPFTDYCTPRVLTMERIDGIKLTDRGQLEASGISLPEVARRGAELYMEMIFTHGLYHADPHPGNLVLLPGGVIGLLDFGLVGRIEERLREAIEEMLLAIVQHDVALLTTVIKRIGKTPPDLDDAALANDVADFVGVYATQSLEHFDVAGALRDMTGIINRYHITLPIQATLLIKVLITLEGTTKMLHPDFSLMEVMQPFYRKMMLRRLSPARQYRKLRRVFLEVEQLAEVLPRRLMDIVEQVRLGKFDVHLEHRGLGPSVNRLVMGLLVSALFLGSSLMLSLNVPPVLFMEPTYMGLHRVSILGLLGSITSMLMGLRLMRAIVKSGHLDRRDR